MSLIFATQLAAVATAVLALFAIVTAAFAFLAYRAQAQEVGILQQQMKEQQDAFEREAVERRRAQAARIVIAAPNEPGEVAPYAMNTSDLPVYDVQLWYPKLDDPAYAYSPGNPENIGVLPPGEEIGGRGRGPTYASGDLAVTETILTFRDAAGVRWIRTGRGDLEEQSGPRTAAAVLATVRSLRAGPQNH